MIRLLSIVLRQKGRTGFFHRGKGMGSVWTPLLIVRPDLGGIVTNRRILSCRRFRCNRLYIHRGSLCTTIRLHVFSFFLRLGPHWLLPDKGFDPSQISPETPFPPPLIIFSSNLIFSVSDSLGHQFLVKTFSFWDVKISFCKGWQRIPNRTPI